jgi:hypothetical protein
MAPIAAIAGLKERVKIDFEGYRLFEWGGEHQPTFVPEGV